jgi:Seed maturation protein
MPKTPIDNAAASRIQSATAKRGDGGVSKGSFAARAQSAAARNENKAATRNQFEQSQSEGVAAGSWCSLS